MIRSSEIKEVNLKSISPSLGEISAFLDKKGTLLKIDTLNWKSFSYKPQVAVSAAYTNCEILLKYYITEDYFKAEITETNDKVFEDSCVEFFIAPEQDGIYYNIEFNGLGTCLLEIGKNRSDRLKADPSLIQKIRRTTSVGTLPVNHRVGSFDWTITIAIPFEVFVNHHIASFKGRAAKVNFYKCGDKLKVPHYLTWNPVGSERPDFHKPEYFGELRFI